MRDSSRTALPLILAPPRPSPSLRHLSFSSPLQDNEGAVNKDTLGTLNAQLAGCITSILVSGFIATIGSWLKPQNFDWDVMRNEIKLITDDLAEDSKPKAPMEGESPEELKAAKEWIVKWGGARSESRTRHLLPRTSMLVAAPVTACPTHLHHEVDILTLSLQATSPSSSSSGGRS